jgi:hypothetical protein
MIAKLTFIWIGVILLTVASAMAEERFRTPAEIELRLSEIAQRLQVLAQDAVDVAATRQIIDARVESAAGATRDAVLAEAERAAARQRAIDQEAEQLRAEHTRLEAIPTRTATGPLQRADPQGLGTLDLSGGDQITSARAFNPAISLIPDANYYSDNRRGRAFPETRQADGFAMAGEDDRAETDPDRGFNLREVELSFMGTIDPYFDVWAAIVIQQERIFAEEAYVQTRRFIPGLQLRFGRFLSGIGYINRQHPHQWDFFDQALPYEAILGGGLADTGVQLTWLPALPVYTLFGFEALQGDSSRLAGTLTGDFPDLFEERAGPRLLTGFIRVSPDIGASSALQIGGSYAFSRDHQEIRLSDDDVEEAFEGHAWLTGADLVWRYESGQAYGRGNATLQAEYLYRHTAVDRLTPLQMPLPDDMGARRSTQDGLYVQGVYGIAARWTAGGRFETLGLRNRLTIGGVGLDAGTTTRSSANLTFNPTEFSRLRAQYSHMRLQRTGVSEPVHQFSVQLQMSLGAHGAHRF